MNARLELMSPAELALADAERQAVALAARHAVGERVSAIVYRVGDQIVVRTSTEPAPEGRRDIDYTVHCIAQRWNPREVQIRRAGAWSDWIAA